MRPAAALPLRHVDPDLTRAGTRMVRHGAAWTVGGIALSYGAYALGAGSTPSILALGAMAFGLVDLVRGAAILTKKA